MNRRLDSIMDTYLECLPGYLDDVFKHGFISDHGIIKDMQTKINIHYFKKSYVDKIVGIMVKYFEERYFKNPSNENRIMTGFILLTGSVGNHNNWEPRLLNSLKECLKKRNMNFKVVFESEKNKNHGGGLLVQFLRPGIKKVDNLDGKPWHYYYTNDDSEE